MKSNRFFIIPVLAVFCGCSKDVQQSVLFKPPGCDSSAFLYDGEVRPVIISNCSGPTCHSGGNANYDYRTYEVTVDRVRNGDLEERLLLPENDILHMPPGRSLATCDLFTMRGWIYQGFKKN